MTGDCGALASFSFCELDVSRVALFCSTPPSGVMPLTEPKAMAVKP